MSEATTWARFGAADEAAAAAGDDMTLWRHSATGPRLSFVYEGKMGLPLHHSATTTTTDRPTTLATNRRHRNWRTALAMQTTIHRLDI